MGKGGKRSSTRRELVLIITSLLILAALVGLVLHFGKITKSPEGQFVRDLQKKADCLMKEMRDARGTWMQKTTVMSNNRIGSTKTETPRMLRVTSAAKELREHFDMVPLSLILSLAHVDFEAWAARVQNTVISQRTRLKSEVRRMERDVRENPDLYPNSQIAELTILSGDLPVYGWTEDDRLYVVSGNRGIVLDAVLDFDIDVWLEDIKSKVD